jgi:hypothetical protein
MSDKPKVSRSLRRYFSELGKRSAAKLTRKEQLERAASARRGRAMKRQIRALAEIEANNAKIRAKLQQEAPEISQEVEITLPTSPEAEESKPVVREPAHVDLAVNRPSETRDSKEIEGTPESEKGTPAGKNITPAVVHQDLTTENFFTIKAPRPMRIR